MSFRLSSHVSVSPRAVFRASFVETQEAPEPYTLFPRSAPVRCAVLLCLSRPLTGIPGAVAVAAPVQAAVAAYETEAIAEHPPSPVQPHRGVAVRDAGRCRKCIQPAALNFHGVQDVAVCRLDLPQRATDAAAHGSRTRRAGLGGWIVPEPFEAACLGALAAMMVGYGVQQDTVEPAKRPVGFPGSAAAFKTPGVGTLDDVLGCPAIGYPRPDEAHEAGVMSDQGFRNTHNTSRLPVPALNRASRGGTSASDTVC
jgi:hypothetical protein